MVLAVEAAEELSRRHLADFCAYVNNWRVPDHQLRIIEELEWVEATPDARLVIVAPPRHGKSHTAAIDFVTWALGRGFSGRGPIRRVAIAAYGASLASSFSETVRDRFRHVEGITRSIFRTCALSTDAAHEWHLQGAIAAEPSCLAVGVGGPFTGHGADLIVVDDPIKTPEEARSEVYRDRTWRWWNTVADTRFQPGGRAVVIMTRWHQDDLVGRLLDPERGEREAWRVLHLPALDEHDNALWPDQFPASRHLSYRARNPEEFAALYQGDPTPPKGKVWDREWFDNSAKPAPAGMAPVVTAWDTAYGKDQTGDYTAWCRMGRSPHDGHYYVIDIGRSRPDFPELVSLVSMGRGGPLSEVALVEDKASGQSAIQSLRQNGQRGVIARAADTDKEARAKAVSPLVQAGMVHVDPALPMYEQFVSECTSFPHGKHDDMMDAFVHALAYLSEDGDSGEAVVRGYRA